MITRRTPTSVIDEVLKKTPVDHFLAAQTKDHGRLQIHDVYHGAVRAWPIKGFVEHHDLHSLIEIVDIEILAYWYVPMGKALWKK